MESMLAPATAKLKAEAKAAAEIKASVKEPTFHDKERARMAADPENNAHKGAVALGKKRAADFLESALNTHHIQHKGNFEVFKSQFNMDPKALEDDYVAKACDELNAHEFEKSDPNYENTLKLKYKPFDNPTITKMKIYDNFCNAVDEKHKRIGYQGDKNFVESYASTYCLTPNNSTINFREFQPKL